MTSGGNAGGPPPGSGRFPGGASPTQGPGSGRFPGGASPTPGPGSGRFPGGAFPTPGPSSSGRFPGGAFPTPGSSGTGRLPGAQKPAPGELLAGRYELHEVLGQGGHGVVFRAVDRRLGAEVAVKLVPATGRLAERLVREGQLVSRLDAPGIVRVLDGGERPGGWSFLVQELVRGARPLDAVVPTLDREARLACVLSIADALAVAHAQGVVHRDVKAGNVLVDGNGRARLTDFGIAKAADEERHDRLTRTGELVGTPSAMAPEQLQGKEIGPPVDVWALGVLLYELLTDEAPFGGAHPAQLFASVCEQDPTAPRARDATIPAAVEQVCLRALAKAADERPRDASVFARELRQALAQSARPAASRGPNPVLLVALGISVGAVVMAATAVGLGWVRVERATPPSATEVAPPPATEPPPRVTEVAPRVTEVAPPPATEPPPRVTEAPPPRATEPPPRATEAPPPPRAPTLAERAQRQLDAGDRAGAVMTLAAREGAEALPAEAAQLLDRVRSDVCMKHHELASADPRAAEAQTLQQQGEVTRALALYDVLVADLPGSALLRLNRASARGAVGDLPGAIEDLVAAVAFAPRADAAWLNLSIAKFAIGDETGGYDALDRGLAINGGGLSLLTARGTRWHVRADQTRDPAEFARALADYDRVLEADPRAADVRLNRATLRAFALGDVQNAVLDLQALVTHHPDAVPVLAQVAKVFLTLERPADALPVLERACTLAKSDPAALAELEADLARARAALGR